MKKERKYNGLRKSAEQSPVSTMLIVLLLAAGIFLFPVEDMMRLFTGRYGLTEELAGHHGGALPVRRGHREASVRLRL